MFNSVHKLCRLAQRCPARACCVVALLPVVLALALGSAQGQTLYLLAGTATNYGPEAYPVTLYTVDRGHRLQRFRGVTSKDEGLCAVRYDFGDKVYVSYPPGSATTVSVIHIRKPAAADEVEFNPKRLITLFGLGGVAAGEVGQSYVLFLLVAPGAPRESARLVSVAGDPVGREPRVAVNHWDLYKSLRFEGCPGGPASCIWPELQLAAGQLVIGTTPKHVEINTAPPSFSNVKGPERFKVVAASARFFLTGPWYNGRALASGNVRTCAVYVRDREFGSWKRIVVPGNTSRSRLFGTWLATIMESWNPGNRFEGNTLYPAGDNNPGRENERAEATPLLPSVRGEYNGAGGEGQTSIIPGTLILDHLVDKRRVTIHTNEEDSEILEVRDDGLVLYRVNDEIFSAQIQGDKLGPSTVVVKGDDVPEVHWVFWSKASPDSPRSANPPVDR